MRGHHHRDAPGRDGTERRLVHYRHRSVRDRTQELGLRVRVAQEDEEPERQAELPHVQHGPRGVSRRQAREHGAGLDHRDRDARGRREGIGGRTEGIGRPQVRHARLLHQGPGPESQEAAAGELEGGRHQHAGRQGDDPRPAAQAGRLRQVRVGRAGEEEGRGGGGREERRGGRRGTHGPERDGHGVQRRESVAQGQSPHRRGMRTS
mmetsp:Transcript_21076/g.39467  ORF Transcript_21076/g.39467 Transcript_21076/m.39467 type:complete len:207 (-) Transcript_21076:352-972(-)